jgi:hypothetical protein
MACKGHDAPETLDPASLTTFDGRGVTLGLRHVIGARPSLPLSEST